MWLITIEEFYTQSIYRYFTKTKPTKKQMEVFGDCFGQGSLVDISTVEIDFVKDIRCFDTIMDVAEDYRKIAKENFQK